jgi:CRISPR/Cas system-associated protein Csm6
MFGFGKKNKKNKKAQKPQSREELIAEAMSNARKAKDEIGEENLQRIAQAMMKKENSATEQAKKKIKSMDQDKVADHLRIMLDDK